MFAKATVENAVLAAKAAGEDGGRVGLHRAAVRAVPQDHSAYKLTFWVSSQAAPHKPHEE